MDIVADNGAYVMRHSRWQSRFCNWLVMALLGSATLVCGASCGNSSTAPSSASLSGTWSGTIGPGPGGSLNTVTITLILTQSGATVSGTFTVTAGVTTVGGNVAGSVAGGNYSGTMTVVNGSSSCPAVVSGTTTDSGRALAWTSAGGFIGDDCRGIEDQGAFVINARK